MDFTNWGTINYRRCKSKTYEGKDLANKLVERGHEVIFFSSKFNHQKKRQRKHKEKINQI